MSAGTLGRLPENPTFSVLSTVYQAERFLERALDSVLAQDWPRDRLQYVIVNDGSTDGSADILDRYAAEYPFIEVIHQENRGLRGAIDRALSVLEGDLIRPVSGDDMLAPGALRIAADHLAERPNVGLLYTDMTVMDDNDAVLYPSFMRAHGLQPHTGRPIGALLQGNFVSGGAITLRAEMRDVVSPIPEQAAWEDYWWAWQVAHVADLDYLDVPTYRYRMHGSNMALGATGDRLTYAQGEELRFRRWMLRTLAPGEVSLPEMLSGFQRVASLTGQLMAASGRTPDDILAVDDEGRAQGAQEAQLACQAAVDGDLERAALHCVRALGCDPHRGDMQELITHMSDVIFEPAAQPAPAPAPVSPQPGPALDVRSLVIVADADELVSDPSLLTTYARQVGPDTDATLVIHAVDWAPGRAANELGALQEQCGITPDTCPDLLAHLGPAADRDALERLAHAVLTNAPHATLPTIASGDNETLAGVVAAVSPSDPISAP